MGADNGFGQDAAIEGLPLIDELAFDHHDGGMPTAFEERFPPLCEPVADVKLNRNAFKLCVKRVLNDVECQ